MATIDRSIGAYHDSSLGRIRKIGRYVGPASYVSGGDPILPGELGLASVIEHMSLSIATDGTFYRTLVFVPNAATYGGFLRWLDTTNGTEIAPGANLSNFSARFEAVGH